MTSLKEFKFAENYFDILAEVIKQIQNLANYFLKINKYEQAVPAPHEQLSHFHDQILQLKKCEECFLGGDRLSKNSLSIFCEFLKIVYKFMEDFMKMDKHCMMKLRQSLYEFLLVENMVYTSELYYLFKGKRLLSLLDTIIEDKIDIEQGKLKALGFFQELDYVMLPKRVFISKKMPKLKVDKDFLWQIGDKEKVSTLKVHIVDVEVEILNLEESEEESWTVQAILEVKDNIFHKQKVYKETVKSAKEMLNFRFMVEFISVCRHRVAMKVQLMHHNGFVVDSIVLSEIINCC